MHRWIVRLLQDESGTVPIEYALIGSLISIMAIAGMIAIGSSVNGYLSAAYSGLVR